MKKPAIFIDAYISNEEKKKWFDYNVTNFIKAGFDVFVISNKMISFDKFENVKYFEYDSKNRLLTDKSKYSLCSTIDWGYQLYDEWGGCFFSGRSYIHGFTNWTVLYNLKKICKVLKSYGYEHMIRSEYDVIFKNYDLMNTIFKDFGSTEKSKTCMILKDQFGCTTNFFLIDVNYIDSIIPEMETEDDYIKFIHSLYGRNLSPVFEELFHNIIKNNCEYLDKPFTYAHIENIGACESSGDTGFRHDITYGSILMTPINNNTEFFMHNGSDDTSIYIQYTTADALGNPITTIHEVLPKNWNRFKCSNFVEIKTSQMKLGKYLKFDLSKPCTFTIVRN
jgi:hypothetical protein